MPFINSTFMNNITTQGAASTGLLMGGGTNASPIITSVASKNFFDFRTKTTDATGGDSRGIYWRHYISGTLANGEAGRFFTTVDGAANGCHGIHASLSFGAAGTCTGEVAALRGTLHIPNATLGGTNGAVSGELYSDGASSAVSGSLAAFRCILSGNATGIAAMDDAAGVFSLEGVTIGAGNMVVAAVKAACTHLIKIKINGTSYWLMANSVGTAD